MKDLYIFRRRMIGFRTYLLHMTNLRNSIFLCYKIDSKTFYSSSSFTLRNSIDSHFKVQSTHSIEIVDSPLLKECSNYVLTINGTTQKRICKKKHDCISICTPTHKGINKRLSHFGTNTLFLKNHSIIKSNCYVKQFSSISGQEDAIPLTKDTNILQRLSESAPVEFAQDSFVWLHTYTGLPWWATIILATIAVRSAITFPLYIHQHYVAAKIENLKYEMNDIARDLKIKTSALMDKFNWPEDFTKKLYNRELKKQWNELIVRENCHPMKNVVLVLVQIPIWVTLSFSLRNLCSMLPTYKLNAYQCYLELTTGGFGWMLNLTEGDKFLILPVSLGLLNLVIIEIQTTLRVKEPTRIQKGVINFLRLLSVVIIPIAAYIPSSIALYWATSSACGLCQNLILVSPKFRRLSGIPETESELSHPYSYLYDKMKNKYNFGVRSRFEKRA